MAEEQDLVTGPGSGAPVATGATGVATAQAKEVASTAGEGAREVAQRAAEQTRLVAGEAKGEMRRLVDEATNEVRMQSDAEINRAAGAVQTLATQLVALVEGRPEEAGPLPDYARQLADRMQQTADRVSSNGARGLIDDGERLARRRPGLFLAGAIVAGFAAGRLIRGAQAAASDTSSTSESQGIGGQQPGLPMAPPIDISDSTLTGMPTAGTPTAAPTEATPATMRVPSGGSAA
jgi:hypothetical protein